MSYFPPVQTCSHCGCENPDGIAYCRDCGMTLRAQQRIAAPTPTPELAALAYPPPTPAQVAVMPQAAAPVQPQAGPPGYAPGGYAPQAYAQAPVPILQAPLEAAGAGAGNTLRSAEVQHVEVPCPRCHERNPVESRFCHSCGFSVGSLAGPAAPLPATPAMPAPAMPGPAMPAPAPAPHAAEARPPVCARCRGTNDAGSDFCKFCGARLGEPPAAAAAPGPAAAPGTAPAYQASFPQGMSAAMANAPIPMRTAMVVEARAVPAQAPQVPVDAALGGARAVLVRIAKDGSEGVHHPITGDVTDVGRAEGQIILPDDPYLSPRHARLVTRAAPAGATGARTTLTVIDLGSTNGIFVRLRAPHTLVHGDLLLLGQQVLRFEAVTEIEGARGPAMQHGVLLFGSPAPVARARLFQRTVDGLVRDVLYLVRDETVFGRETGDRTYPDDVFMSRRHAAIRRAQSPEGGHVLHDLGSSNGTFVQVHGEHPLIDGDQFRIGHHLFRVDVPGAVTGGASASGGGVV